MVCVVLLSFSLSLGADTPAGVHVDKLTTYMHTPAGVHADMYMHTPDADKLTTYMHTPAGVHADTYMHQTS